MIYKVILPLVDITNCCQYPHPLLGGFAESSDTANPIAWCICSTACVCMFVTLVHPDKATEWNEISYTAVVPSNTLLDSFQSSNRKGRFGDQNTKSTALEPVGELPSTLLWLLSLKADTHFTIPHRVKSLVDVVSWLHMLMVYT